MQLPIPIPIPAWIAHAFGIGMPAWSPRRPDAPLVVSPLAFTPKAFVLRRQGISECLRCGVPWYLADGHSTWYCPHPPGTHTFPGEIRSEPLLCMGGAPLCEGCWQALGIEERLPYYLQLSEQWYAELQDMEQEKRATDGDEMVTAWRHDLDTNVPALLAAVRAGR